MALLYAYKKEHSICLIMATMEDCGETDRAPEQAQNSPVQEDIVMDWSSVVTGYEPQPPLPNLNYPQQQTRGCDGGGTLHVPSSAWAPQRWFQEEPNGADGAIMNQLSMAMKALTVQDPMEKLSMEMKALTVQDPMEEVTKVPIAEGGYIPMDIQTSQEPIGTPVPEQGDVNRGKLVPGLSQPQTDVGNNAHNSGSGCFQGCGDCNLGWLQPCTPMEDSGMDWSPFVTGHESRLEREDVNRGELVTGLSQLQTDFSDSSLVSPWHFLEKSVEAVGSSLNPVVSYVHNDPRNDVKFRVRKKMCKKKMCEHCCTYNIQNVAANDPSNWSNCPEAFDGRKLLRHIKRNASYYASFLELRGSSHDLKTSVDLVLGMARPNHSLTTSGLVHALFQMEGLLGTILHGLTSVSRYELVPYIEEGLKELQNIRSIANHARRLSLELNK